MYLPSVYSNNLSQFIDPPTPPLTQTLNLTFLYVTVSTLKPTVGIVVTLWPSFNLYRIAERGGDSQGNKHTKNVCSFNLTNWFDYNYVQRIYSQQQLQSSHLIHVLYKKRKAQQPSCARPSHHQSASSYYYTISVVICAMCVT